MSADRIGIANLQKQHTPIENELVEVFRTVLRSGRFVLGPEVEALERESAQLHGVRHGIGMSSGTDALLAGLMALGIGPGDEVITTPLSFFATAGTVVRVGAVPVFADVDDDILLDPRAVEAAVTPRTKAVILVHLFGRVGQAPKVSVPIIEDAAQSFAAEGVGKLGALACVSFFPTKNLGALGDAGMVLTDDDALAEKLRKLRIHGQRAKYIHQLVGGNFRIDALQCALLRAKLPYLATWNARRMANARRYDELLRGSTPLRIPRPFRDKEVVHQYVVRAPRRDELRKFLSENGVDTEVHYPLLYHQDALAQYARSCPRAEQIATEVVALPVHSELEPAEIEKVASLVKKFYG